jgi:hypothetical protein
MPLLYGPSYAEIAGLGSGAIVTSLFSFFLSENSMYSPVQPFVKVCLTRQSVLNQLDQATSNKVSKSLADMELREKKQKKKYREEVLGSGTKNLFSRSHIGYLILIKSIKYELTLKLIV